MDARVRVVGGTRVKVLERTTAAALLGTVRCPAAAGSLVNRVVVLVVGRVCLFVADGHGMGCGDLVRESLAYVLPSAVLSDGVGGAAIPRMSFWDTHNTGVSPEVELRRCREAVECMGIVQTRLLIIVVVEEEVWRSWHNDITLTLQHTQLIKSLQTSTDTQTDATSVTTQWEHRPRMQNHGLDLYPFVRIHVV
jgi:hypothetical protein